MKLLVLQISHLPEKRMPTFSSGFYSPISYLCLCQESYLFYCSFLLVDFLLALIVAGKMKGH